MKLQELLNENFSNIVIQCHNAPDADALASGYAVYCYLKQHGKRVRMIYSSPKDSEIHIQKSNLLLMIKDLEIPIEYVSSLEEEPDLLLLVDCQYKEKNVREFRGKTMAVIDHHRVNHPENLPKMQEIRDGYGSCSTIIWDMLLEADADLGKDPKVATALYYGLYTDTTELEELCHPKDMDLVDAVRFCCNDDMLFQWKCHNLALLEMKSAGQALSDYDYYKEEQFAIMEMVGEQGKYLDQNLLGVVSDLLIRVDGVDACIAFCEQEDCFRLSIRTCTREVLAVDLIRFVTSGLGGGGGRSKRKAGGSLEKEKLIALYRSWYGYLPTNEKQVRDLVHHLLADRMKDYYKSQEVFYSGREETVQKIRLPEMQIYEKRTDIVLGYIPATKLYQEGTIIKVRTLEGDAVEKIEEDTYLLFGVEGEPYTNRKSFFEKQYVTCEKSYQFSAEYPPRVTAVDRGDGSGVQEPISLEMLQSLVSTCSPKAGHKIFARPLTCRAKVFSPYREDYLLGEPGDYLVANAQTPKKVHIVKKDIFPKLYERKQV